MVPMAKVAGTQQWEVGTGPQQPWPPHLCQEWVSPEEEPGRGPTIPEPLSGIISEPSPTHSFSPRARAKSQKTLGI